MQGVQAWDRYAYANNNPVRYNDPSGHCIGPLLIVCIAVGTFIVDHAAMISAVALVGAITSFVTADTPQPELVNNPAASQAQFQSSLFAAGGWLTAGSSAIEFGYASNTLASTSIVADDAVSGTEGEFSIWDWSNYPQGSVPKPNGPFRLLEGEEYDAARIMANQVNADLHLNNPSLQGLQIHEIHPVKFGGSPTDISNKIALPPTEHAVYTSWWNRLQRIIERDR